MVRNSTNTDIHCLSFITLCIKETRLLIERKRKLFFLKQKIQGTIKLISFNSSLFITNKHSLY